jgi:two-component system OmpR family sensor kinase
MDGKQAKLTTSLQFKLALWIAIAIAITAAVAGTVSFQSSFHDANELEDDQLREIASMVDVNVLTIGKFDTAIRNQESDPESHVAFQLLSDTPGENESSTEPGVRFPDAMPNGLQTVVANDREWRVFVKPLRSGKRLAIGQQIDVREDIAEHTGQRTTISMMILIPFLIVLMVIVLRYLLAPITKLAREIDSRAQMDMTPIDDRDVPSEITPFTASINQMLKRLETAMEQQRRFVADAAHELRSPLTALSLQAENLAINELSIEAQTQLDAMQGGLLRARTLVSQLLLLARAQLARQDDLGDVVLQSVAREVFEEMMPFADAKQIDLGVAQTCDVSLMANAIDLNTLIRNLVDNAIRYCEPGSRVDVKLSAQDRWAVIEVQDNGPGIPAAEHQKVFEPFYRLGGNRESGSGLGLSIVKNIVSRLSGEVSILSNSSSNNLNTSSSAVQGTTIIVKLPKYQP